LPRADIQSISIMISSTRDDLQEYRDHAAKIIKRIADEKSSSIHINDISMEKENQSGERESAVAVSKRWVTKSDWIVLIVGFHYGSVDDDPTSEGLSVTEWEYKHAVSLRDKKIFVFMADDPDARTAIPGASTGDHNLKSWIEGPNRDKILLFRKKLQQSHLRMFKSLPIFRDQLERTLREHIDELTRPSVGALAQLVAAVGDAIKDFTDKVELIAECKGIHDHLHEILDKVVRPLHDVVLPLWLQEDHLQDEIHNQYVSRLLFLAKREGALKAALEGPTSKLREDESDLFRSTQVVLRCAEALHPEPVLIRDRATFQELFETFSIDVNAAFREADTRMQKETEALDKLRENLIAKVKEARRQHPLTVSEDEQLDKWLNQVGVMLDELDTAINTHHEWQEVHERIEYLEDFRETKSFPNRLRSFCDNYVVKLKRMITQELEVAEAIGDHDVSFRVRSPNVLELRERIGRLDVSKDEDHFDEVRKPFDSVFYDIDKRTLSEVKGAREKVLKYTELRNELLRAHSAVSTTTIGV
jgi:Domain of unknown function (DUF4062)